MSVFYTLFLHQSSISRLNGIAGGIVGVMKDCIIPTVQDTVHTVGTAVLPKSTKTNHSTSNPEDLADEPMITTSITDSPSHGGDIKSKTSLMSALSLDKFEPRLKKIISIYLFTVVILKFCTYYDWHSCINLHFYGMICY